MAFKKIELSDSDWIEIYYALGDKADNIKRGGYGPEHKKGQNKEWRGHLHLIMEKIAEKVKV